MHRLLDRMQIGVVLLYKRQRHFLFLCLMSSTYEWEQMTADIQDILVPVKQPTPTLEDSSREQHRLAHFSPIHFSILIEPDKCNRYCNMFQVIEAVHR